MTPHAAPAFTGMSAFPPSIGGEPLSFLWTVFGLLLLILLSLEWFWRTALSVARERNRRWNDPITIKRLIVLLLLLCPILGGGPDLIIMMKWADWTPAMREIASNIDRRLDGLLWMPLAVAWLLAQLSGPMIDFQLVREPLPINLWPTWRQLARPLQIGAGVLALALLITFSR